MSAGNTSYSIPTLPSRVGMRDCYLMSLFSLGEATKKVRIPSPVHVFILTHHDRFVKIKTWVGMDRLRYAPRKQCGHA